MHLHGELKTTAIMSGKESGLPLAGQVAIITGGANGIGRGIAFGLAASGANIVIADIDSSAGVKTKEEIEKTGRQCLFVITDVRKDENLDQLVEYTLSNFGRIDILVNNAGINAAGGLLGVSREDLRSVFETDLIGPFILTQRVAREMINLGIKGRMVFISSIHSVVAHYHPHYSAAKIGLERLVQDAALELAPYGIRVNGIRPGGIQIRGDMQPGSPEIESPEVPLENRRGLPAEIADLVNFLVTKPSRYITGAIITIDGGLSLLSFSSINSRDNMLQEQSRVNIPAPHETNSLKIHIVRK
jgi:NAD(P)-dependent dehydrogenase (short-subunit alcohol dehydrogenase family)